MESFSGCRVTVAGGDGQPLCEDDDADLRLEDESLLLSYWDERGAVVLVGSRSEPDRWELVARSRPRRATLRREGPRSFAGAWQEGDEAGSLRVELPAAAEREASP